jgi:hypothetical protein
MSRGYFFLAFGKYYVDEAANLVRTLRKFGDRYPVSILCGENDVKYLESIGLFDKIIVFDFNNEYSNEDKTQFEKYGGTTKILMCEYSPYDETIFTDTDMLVQHNPKGVWDAMSSFNQAYVVTGGPADPNDILIQNISTKLNKPISEIHTIHSGIVYYNKKHKDFDLICDKLKFYWKNYHEFGLDARLFRDGKVDEHAILAAMADINYITINPCIIPIITHNYHYDIELPSNIVTGGNMYEIWAELESPIPFIHMFKNNRNHYEILYERLINL